MRKGWPLAALAASAGLLCAPPVAAPAASAGEEAARIFAAGNDHYASGRYAEAARHYQQLLNQGFRSEAVHYNLDFLGSLTADKISQSGAQTTAFFVERLLSLTTPDQDAVAFTAAFLVAAVLVGVLIASSSPRLRRGAAWCCAVAAFPLAVTGGSLAVKQYRAATTVHAVVLQERVDVRSGPGDDNTSLFTVHEGLKVRLRSRQGSWSQVSLENGLNGWVPSSSLGVI